MASWIRPLIFAVVLALLAAACSGGGEVATSSTTTTTTTIAPTTTSSTTTTLPPVAPVASGAGDTFVVTDFGAVADAKIDDAPAFQAAVDAADAAGGGVVLIPPVPGRGAYVLGTTVTVPTGVAVVGSPAGSAIDAEGPYVWPDTELNGVKILARPADPSAPLFDLGSGTTVRGLWITYDRQPLPSDADILDEDGDYIYRSFADAQTFLVDEHVEVMAPTFYIADGSHVTIADIVADRYYDFLWMQEGGPLRVDGMALFGYNRAFTVVESDAPNVFSNIDIAPRVGPVVPGDDGQGNVHTWVFGAIAARKDNVAFQFGRSDGFVLDNVSITGVNTAIRLGAAFDHPIIDPFDESFTTSVPGIGPWGQISNLRVSHVVVGLHLVAPAVNATQMTNVSIGADLVDGATFPATDGTGDLVTVARQAALLVEPSYGADNNGSPEQVPAVLAANFSVVSEVATDLYGEASRPIDAANGRIFLVNGDLGMEINGFAMPAPYDEAHMVAAGSAAEQVAIRIRGFLAAGRPEQDKLVETTGVTILSNDVVIIEQAPQTAPPTAPPTTAATTTSTTTTTTAPEETSTTNGAPDETSTTEGG